MLGDPEPARPEEWPAAFQLCFRHLPDADREQHVANALTRLKRGEWNAAGTFVLRENNTVVGALTCLPLPGAIALLSPPQCRERPDQRAREDRLLQHACRWLRTQGARMAQALLLPYAIFGTEALERNGFVHLTQLCYLRHDLDVPLPCLSVPARLDYIPASAQPDRFADTLQRTYEGTLDCPEINDIRTMAEVLEGHRSQGTYDPRLWWLVEHRGQAIGVLIAARTPETGEWDVAYVGIVPEARRRGFGREIMLQVLFEARAAEVPGVTLAVDGRNEPARALYRALDFQQIDRREVFLAIWG